MKIVKNKLKKAKILSQKWNLEKCMIKLKKQICFIYSQISEKTKSTNPNVRK